jgi:hypothetical protein
VNLAGVAERSGALSLKGTHYELGEDLLER